MRQAHHARLRTPPVDAATFHLRVDPAGDVRWADEPAHRLLRQVPHPARTNLVNLAHRDERRVVELALAEAVADGRAQVVVRLAMTTGTGERSYAHLDLSRSRVSRRGDEGWGGTDVTVRGRDVTGLVLGLPPAGTLQDRDPLTGLDDRTAFLDRLRHELAGSSRGGTDVAVLLATVAGFEAMSETHGNATVEAVLVEIGRRMAAALPPEDTPARVDRDEFAVVCPGLADRAQAATLADVLRAGIAEPVTVRGHRQSVSLSVSLAFGSGADADDRAETLLRRAERARGGFEGEADRTDR